MRIDTTLEKRDMRSYVEAAMAVSKDHAREGQPSSIVSSISFSQMLDNAIKIELSMTR